MIGDLRNPRKLNILEDTIHYKIRQQDGSFVAMTLPDTKEWRLFVTWVQIHD